MSEVPVADITQYAAEDADMPLRLQPLLQKRLEQYQLTELNNNLEVPLIDALVELEFNGIRVDTARLKILSDTYAQRMSQLEREIYDLAGHEFNIGSPKQLVEVLFSEQKLRSLSETKPVRVPMPKCSKNWRDNIRSRPRLSNTVNMLS